MTGVTLHPVVVYYASEKDHQKVDHRSFVIVSDEMSHSSTTVHAILNKIIPLLKQMNPQTEMIHYWTDGPSSQYRNKQVSTELILILMKGTGLQSYMTENGTQDK